MRTRGPENGGAKEGTPELYLGDPDGIVCQLQDVTYCGGAGVKSETMSDDNVAFLHDCCLGASSSLAM